MATMNVSLPDDMKEWVEAQAASGRYANVSDYVRDVLRREQAMMGRLSRKPTRAFENACSPQHPLFGHR